MPDNQPLAIPPLYRLHIRTAFEDRAATFAFCRDGAFLGVGWGMTPEPLEWAAYEEKAYAQDGVVNSSVRAIHDAPDGALIWTRDMTRGVYYLARVVGPWVYLHGPEAEGHDIRNVRPVQMVSCGVESRVPGSVLSRFIAGRALQRVHDEPAARYSASLFAELTGEPFPWRPSLDEVLTSYLDDQDLENLVCVYLQRRLGYIVLPSLRRSDTPAYEYVLRHADGHEAVVQVKRGWSTVPRDAASLPTTEVDRVFVFSPTGTYGPDPVPNVVELAYQDVVEFMRERKSLPPTVEHWVRRALGTP